jgi:hypothetical protein
VINVIEFVTLSLADCQGCGFVEPVATNCCSSHDAPMFLAFPGPAAMINATVIPHDQVKGRPIVNVDEPIFRCVG